MIASSPNYAPVCYANASDENWLPRISLSLRQFRPRLRRCAAPLFVSSAVVALIGWTSPTAAVTDAATTAPTLSDCQLPLDKTELRASIQVLSSPTSFFVKLESSEFCEMKVFGIRSDERLDAQRAGRILRRISDEINCSLIAKVVKDNKALIPLTYWKCLTILNENSDNTASISTPSKFHDIAKELIESGLASVDPAQFGFSPNGRPKEYIIELMQDYSAVQREFQQQAAVGQPGSITSAALPNDWEVVIPGELVRHGDKILLPAVGAGLGGLVVFFHKRSRRLHKLQLCATGLMKLKFFDDNEDEMSPSEWRNISKDFIENGKRYNPRTLHENSLRLESLRLTVREVAETAAASEIVKTEASSIAEDIQEIQTTINEMINKFQWKWVGDEQQFVEGRDKILHKKRLLLAKGRNIVRRPVPTAIFAGGNI